MQMSESQLEFFRALNAPFGPDDLYTTSKGGRNLTYVKAPTLMNRLDDVAGPAGWDVEYRPTERGFTCKLGILVPAGEPSPTTGIDTGTKVWHYKEDGGGFEGMTKKVGNESVADEDNDEKSGYTNAFRRACYAWGLGRDLWRCGVPQYLGRDPVVPDVPPASAPARPAYTPGNGNGNGNGSARYNAPAPAKPRPQNGDGQGNGGRTWDNFKPPPRPGKGAYAWMMHLEGHFGDGIVKLANEIAKANGFPFKSSEWDEDALGTVAWSLIDEIKTWKNYRGEFDHLEDPRAGE